MFVDSEGRYVTAGQWHDEKFKAFTDPWMWQQLAPKSMILGGMQEAGEDDIDGVPTFERREPAPLVAMKEPIVKSEEVKEVSVEA